MPRDARSRSPRGVLAWLRIGARTSKETTEDKMKKWAQKSESNATGVKDVIDRMQIADFEKCKMVAIFKCPHGEVEQKMRQEFLAKKMKAEVVEAVVNGIGELTFYEKMDSHFEITSKASEKGKSNLYQFGVWGKMGEDDLMEVSVWCITTNFKKGCAGTATKNEIDSLKQYMEQETRTDVLQIASGSTAAIRDVAQPPSTMGDMIAYAKNMQSEFGVRPGQEDELINKMEITGFTKYKTNTSFQCKKDKVEAKVAAELEAKKFPKGVISAVMQGLNTMSMQKRTDENFHCDAHKGTSTYYKYAFWCAEKEKQEMEVSMVCIAADFKKKSDGPLSKTEVEVMGQYLGQEACTDVLKVHAPDQVVALQRTL